MTDTTTTPFGDKCEILADLWMLYRDDEDFVDFVEYNDLGLPLAYAIKEEIVLSTKMAEQVIDETFTLLLGALQLEDTGFDSIDDLLDAANK